MARRPGRLARLLHRTAAGTGRYGDPPRGGRGAGGAGVREPRRPRPSPPSDHAAAFVPAPTVSVDLASVDLVSGLPRS